MGPPLATDFDHLQSGVAQAWKIFDVATVNGNSVRFRVMEGVAAEWHAHANSDELFYVVSGAILMDTESGTSEIQAGQLLVVPAGMRHRARAQARALMLVVDSIG